MELSSAWLVCTNKKAIQAMNLEISTVLRVGDAYVDAYSFITEWNNQDYLTL